MKAFTRKILSPWLTLLMLASVLSIAPSSYAQYPSDFSIKELEQEINKKEDCAYLSCNAVNKVVIKEVDAQKGTVKMVFSVDARVDSIAVLPLNNNQVSVQNLLLNNKPWYGASIALNGQINTVVLKGTNEIEMDLLVKGQSFNLPGYQKRVIDSSGSKFLKIRNDSLIEITKESSAINKPEEIVAKFTTIPLYVVHRTIILEQKWKMKTTVSLLDGVGGNISRTLLVQALAGESVLSNDIKNEGGQIKINITNSAVSWDSVLEEKPILSIQGSQDYLQKVTMINNANWLFDFTSLEPVNKSNNTRYTSSYDWLFWPQDKLTLHINKPSPVLGNTVAVQSLSTQLDTRKSPNELSYFLQVKASLGSKVKLELPHDLKLTNINLNSQKIPFKSGEPIVFVDINAGTSEIKLSFDMKDSIGLFHEYPQLKMEIPSANYSYAVQMPQKRWVLWTGGANLRASILLWGILISCVLFAYPLSKFIKSPLGWRSWSLLLLGLSQSGLPGLLLIIVWFALLNYKHAGGMSLLRRGRFNMLQVVVSILTVFVVSVAIGTITKGLLNYPNLFVEGENSTTYSLYWYSEQAQQFSPWLISLPLWVYRVLMFSWSIWFAFNVMHWLKWAWEGFMTGGIWIPAPPKKAVEAVVQPVANPENTEDKADNV